MKPFKAKLLLLFGTSIWGATFLWTQIGIRYVSPSLYVIFRFFVALLLCFIFFRKHIVRMPQQILRRGGLLGIFWAVGFLLQTFAIKYTSIGNTAFITNLCVVMTPFVYWFISKERVTAYSKLAVIIGLTGVIIITNPVGALLNFGDILTILSTFCWSLYMSFLHKFTKGTNDIAINAQLITGQFGIGLPILIIYMLIFDRAAMFHINPTWQLLASILFNSVMASFLVSFIQISVQKYTTPVNASLIFALEPIFASIFSFIILGLVMTLRGYIGAGVILLAVFIGDILEGIIKRSRPSYYKK